MHTSVLAVCTAGITNPQQHMFMYLHQNSNGCAFLKRDDLHVIDLCSCKEVEAISCGDLVQIFLA